VRRRRTDYGTIILHWLLVAAFGIALFSGLRIAAEAADRTWINLFDVVLPSTNVWIPHMQAAVVLVAVALAYAIYLIRSGRSRRVALDKTRLRGLWGGKQARLGAVSVVLTWAFFVTKLALIVSGGLLYFGVYAGYNTAMVHWYATWLVLGFVGLHILTHFRLGGVQQLLRIFRPQRLPPPPQKLDAVELLRLLVEQSERLSPKGGDHRNAVAEAPLQPVQPLAPATQNQVMQDQAGRASHHRALSVSGGRTANRSNPTLQANPFVVAAAVAITGASIIVASDRSAVNSLQIHRIATAEAPVLDGDTSDPVWRSVQPLSVTTNSGGNFDGHGESRIEIRAVHDGTWAYFLFTWEDPTRSLKQLPLIKQADGWHLLHNGYEAGDEHEFNEDKFSVLLTTMDVTLAGDRTFHAGPHPIPNAPATMTGRGLHFTTAEGVYADVWQWKATSGATGWMDDAHFGPALDPTPQQAANLAPYKGGFAPDPGSANYTNNFVADGGSASGPMTPRRLPKDLAAATEPAMGKGSLDPNVGDSEGARWFMTQAESVPYSSELDRAIPVGTVIPGVVIDGEFSGDRADVRCAARWAAGLWALEVARRLDTHSQYDIPVQTGTFMRVAAFDHSQIRHTRHVRPMRLEVE
jgi:hypothetical protein